MMGSTIKVYFKNIETYPKKISTLSLTELKKFQHKKWYVRFRFYDERITDPAKRWKLVIRKPDINKKSFSISERKANLLALLEAVTFKLKVQGWNPITDSYSTSVLTEKTETDLHLLRAMHFNSALDWAIKQKEKDWSKKTKQDYDSFVKYLKQAAISLELSYKRIIEIRRFDCKLILEGVKDLRTLSNAGYNKYRDYFSSLMSCLEEFEIIEYNPVHKIKMKPTIKVVAHRPPTDAEMKIIFDKIRSEYRNYYRFLAIEYGTTLRPKEITRLKIKHLHRDLQVFRIIPDREEGNSKTKVEREVVIPNWLLNLLDELHLEKYNPEWYIFSSKNKYGTFLPGPKHIHSNTPTSLWRKIVKNGMKLDITQYSLKKRAGNDMVRLLYNERAHDLIKLPQRQMGHSDSEMTEIYVSEHKVIENEILKEKMPVL